MNITYPAQCKCGHLFLEKYQFKAPTDKGVIGFCWCGFCRTRLNVYTDNRFDGGNGRRGVGSALFFGQRISFPIHQFGVFWRWVRNCQNDIQSQVTDTTTGERN